MTDYVKMINDEIKKSMIAKDKVRLRGIRAIKAALLHAQTDGSNKPIDDERFISILKKLVKQRKDSYQIFMDQNREDLAQIEKEEFEVLEEFLPKMMSGEEIEALVNKVISDTGASSMKDMGMVMGKAMGAAQGRADGKELSAAVRSALQKLG
jgi:uncharacterized protein YqeY